MDGSGVGPGTQTARNRTVTAAIIYGVAAVVLVVPAAFIYGEWQHLIGYGWPGPYQFDIARLNASESASKIQFLGIPSLFVLAGAAVGAGFAARTAGQRVWLVTLVGIVLTVAVVAVVAVLLTPPLASSAG